jgi:hypothetical protein
VLVSWRSLATDAPGLAFNVYRDGKKAERGADRHVDQFQRQRRRRGQL